jgi:hypothetical protein
MNRSPSSPAKDPKPRMQVRVVNVKLKARRWATIAIAVGTSAAIVLSLLISQRVVSPGLWLAAVIALPVACAAVSLFFYRTEEAQQRRVFD